MNPVQAVICKQTLPFGVRSLDDPGQGLRLSSTLILYLEHLGRDFLQDEAEIKCHPP